MVASATDIRIGFQSETYVFTEPSSLMQVDVLLQKENGAITEQTYRILVNISDSVQLESATQGDDYSVASNPTILEMGPEQETVSFPFSLLANGLPEVTEGFSAMSSPEGSLQYSPPLTLFATARVSIQDDDRTLHIITAFLVWSFPISWCLDTNIYISQKAKNTTTFLCENFSHARV